MVVGKKSLIEPALDSDRGLQNQRHLRRHAEHALEDFSELRRNRDDEALWHSLSHHLRHAAYRAGLSVRRHGE